MSDTTCPNCSAAIPAGAAFCTSCGQRMEAQPAPVEDATRVDGPGLHDSTRVVPPAGAWQPSETAAPPASDWSAPSAPAAPPSAPPPVEPQAWEQPAAAPPTWQAQPQQAPPTWGAPQQGAPGAPTWGEPAPVKAATADEPSPIGGLLAIAGGALALVGLFLSWFKLTVGGSDLSISGWDLASSDKSPFESNDPYLLLALGIAGLAVGAALFLGKFRPIARIAAILIGAGIVAVVARDWMSAADIVKDTPGAELKQEIGFFLPIAGAVLLVVGAVLPAKK